MNFFGAHQRIINCIFHDLQGVGWGGDGSATGGGEWHGNLMYNIGIAGREDFQHHSIYADNKNVSNPKFIKKSVLANPSGTNYNVWASNFPIEGFEITDSVSFCPGQLGANRS